MDIFQLRKEYMKSCIGNGKRLIRVKNKSMVRRVLELYNRIKLECHRGFMAWCEATPSFRTWMRESKIAENAQIKSREVQKVFLSTLSNLLFQLKLNANTRMSFMKKFLLQGRLLFLRDSQQGMTRWWNIICQTFKKIP